MLISTAAVRGTNAEVDAALLAAVPVISRAELLGRLMTNYARSVAVSGTHGKTTTSAMIAQMLTVAKVDPTAVIGGDVPAWSSNARMGKSDIFVAEACEAYGSFLLLSPTITVITNVEADHLDHYADLQAIRDAFSALLDKTSYYAVICGDDPESKLLAERHTDNVATYGLSEGCAIRGKINRLGAGSQFTVEALGNYLGEIELSVPGRHNVVNALAAVTVGNLLDIPFEDIAAGLKSFRGTGRRFEILGVTELDVVVVDDYAHHPTEIKATLDAASNSYPERRVIAVFQPHLPSRTRDLMDDFASAFDKADLVLLTDIFLSREKPIDGVTGALLADKMRDVRGFAAVEYIENKDDLPAALDKFVRPGDVVITLGAGDIRTAAVRYLSATSATEERLAHV